LKRSQSFLFSKLNTSEQNKNQNNEGSKIDSDGDGDIGTESFESLGEAVLTHLSDNRKIGKSPKILCVFGIVTQADLNLQKNIIFGQIIVERYRSSIKLLY
jgi:hypothetical protein